MLRRIFFEHGSIEDERLLNEVLEVWVLVEPSVFAAQITSVMAMLRQLSEHGGPRLAGNQFRLADKV
jgi:hypothetical protein